MTRNIEIEKGAEEAIKLKPNSVCKVEKTYFRLEDCSHKIIFLRLP